MEHANQYKDQEILAHNLRWLRKKYGYSQKTMAQLLGIGVGSLRKLEYGEIPPRLTIRFLEPVYVHFRVTPSELLGVRLE